MTGTDGCNSLAVLDDDLESLWDNVDPDGFTLSPVVKFTVLSLSSLRPLGDCWLLGA